MIDAGIYRCAAGERFTYTMEAAAVTEVCVGGGSFGRLHGRFCRRHLLCLRTDLHVPPAGLQLAERWVHGAENALFEPFYATKNDHFAKTGSGQT